MQNQRDLMERLSVFSDQLSEEAKAAFEADLCGVLAYAGGPVSAQTVEAFSYDAKAGRKSFADEFYHAWRRTLDGLLLPADREADALIPFGSRKLAALAGWMMQHCGDEIEAEVLSDPSPVMAMDTVIISATRTIVTKFIDVEPKSKAEMRLAASLPAELSLQRVQDCMDVAPDAPVLKLGLSLMDRALPAAAKKVDRVNAICRAVQQLRTAKIRPASRAWFSQVLTQRSKLEGDVVSAALEFSKGRPADAALDSATQVPLIDAALASFDARVERMTGHVRHAGERPLSGRGLIELTGTTQLGHALWSNVEFESHQVWSKRFGDARRELRDLLAPRLALGQPVFERLLTSSVTRNSPPMIMAMEDAPLFMAEFALIRSRPDVFAANTPVRSVAEKVVGMFEMGLPRLFETVKSARAEDKSHLATRMKAALMTADSLFADDYTRIMRQRLNNEMSK